MKYRMLNWNSNVNAFIYLLLGLLLLIFPIESVNIFGYLIASILMLGGIGYLIRLYKNKPNLTNGDIIYLIISVASIAISISIFIDPTWIIRVLNVLAGALLIINGTMNLINILKFKDSRTRSWWIYLSFIILIIILGILVIINPLGPIEIVFRIAGALLIIDTIITLILTRKVNKMVKVEDKEIIHEEKNSLEKVE